MNTKPPRLSDIAQYKAQFNELVSREAYDQAVALFDNSSKSIRRNPNVVNTIGRALIFAQRPDDARACLETLPPKYRTASIWVNLALAQRLSGEHAVCLKTTASALSRFPGHKEIAWIRASALYALDRVEEASKLIDPLLVEGADSKVLVLAARIASDQGRIGDAIDLYKEGLSKDPENSAILSNLHYLLLHQGRFAEAWQVSEEELMTELARQGLLHRGNQKLVEHFAETPFETWTGQDLNGRDLYLLAHEGIGDQIMYLQFVPLLARFNPGRILLNVEDRVGELMSAGFVDASLDVRVGGFDVVSDLGPNAEKALLSSLPRYFIKSADDFPRQIFLRPPVGESPPRAESNRPRIGLSWWSRAVDGAARSIEVEQLAEQLAAFDVTFVSLQYDPAAAGEAELKRLLGDRFEVVEGLDATRDIAGVARVCRDLDGVVTIPTTLVHICGSLGVKTAVLLPEKPSWRYISDTDKMAWYGDHVRLLSGIGRTIGQNMKAAIMTFTDG